jgi:adenine-specific DNA-methyltransferase
MLDSIVLASSNPVDLAMDCFCGSVSTLQTAYQNNRHWTGVDDSIEAICATLRRFHMGVEAIGDNNRPIKAQAENAKLLNPDFFSFDF